MNNTDMETFWAVLEHGTRTAAAEALVITQPTLTNRIQSLEAEVGAQLFHRGKGIRHIELTEAGQRFLPLAYRWQTLLDDKGRGGDGHTGISADRRGVFHQPVHSSGGVPPLSPPEAAGGPVGADPAWRRLRWRPDGGPP